MFKRTPIGPSELHNMRGRGGVRFATRLTKIQYLNNNSLVPSVQSVIVLNTIVYRNFTSFQSIAELKMPVSKNFKNIKEYIIAFDCFHDYQF